MRLDQIPALPIIPIAPVKKDEKAAPKAKPPDVDAGVSGLQVNAVTRQEQRQQDTGPDDRPDHLDITV